MSRDNQRRELNAHLETLSSKEKERKEERKKKERQDYFKFKKCYPICLYVMADFFGYEFVSVCMCFFVFPPF